MPWKLYIGSMAKQGNTKNRKYYVLQHLLPEKRFKLINIKIWQSLHLAMSRVCTLVIVDSLANIIYRLCLKAA